LTSPPRYGEPGLSADDRRHRCLGGGAWPYPTKDRVAAHRMARAGRQGPISATTPGDATHLHFPSFGPEAAAWL
jgi:hypothetical protein